MSKSVNEYLEKLRARRRLHESEEKFSKKFLRIRINNVITIHHTILGTSFTWTAQELAAFKLSGAATVSHGPISSE